MAGEQIQVTPAVLRWAREQAGFSVDDLLPKFKKLDQWEADDPESFPTYPQLEQLADKFKVPVAVFFFPEPPDLRWRHGEGPAQVLRGTHREA